MDKSFMITPSENSAIVSVHNYDLSEQIDHLSALIKDMKEKNAEYFNDGFHKNVKITWHGCDESQYTPENMWKLLYVLVNENEVIPLFDFDDNTDPKSILSHAIKIFAVLCALTNKLIYCAQLVDKGVMNDDDSDMD